MDAHEWIWRCAERLHQQWPRVDRVDLEHLAESLRVEDRWQRMDPTDAAVGWLVQGIPFGRSPTFSRIDERLG